MTNPIAIPMEDELIHTDEHPYCDDPTCPCQDELAELDTLANMDEYQYYSRSQQLADQATADYYDELQRRNETRQCSDGSWW